MKRCAWAEGSDLERVYHDEEWGRPVHDDRLLFEFLVLQGAQAGLSWLTILKKRQGYREAFDNFQMEKVAAYSEQKIAELLANPNIIRNRLKIEAAVGNARACLAIQQEFGSLDRYLWQFVGGRPICNAWRRVEDIPASSPEAEAMCRDLKKRGFRFVGPTICYALMQAVGMVNDHTVDCFAYHEIKQAAT